MKLIRLVAGSVQPLTDTWFLCLVRSWEQQMFWVVPRIHPMSSRLVTGYYEIRVLTFVQLEWGLLVSLYKIGT